MKIHQVLSSFLTYVDLIVIVSSGKGPHVREKAPFQVQGAKRGSDQKKHSMRTPCQIVCVDCRPLTTATPRMQREICIEHPIYRILRGTWSQERTPVYILRNCSLLAHDRVGQGENHSLQYGARVFVLDVQEKCRD